MDAYAVLEGGGVKGAAFAGALEAAESEGIKFVGYGGASAGAIVAFLATIGYSGKEILDAMQAVPFKELLNEPIAGEFEDAVGEVKQLKNDLKFEKSKLRKKRFYIKSLWYLWRNHKKKLANAKSVLLRVVENNGAYSTDKIVSLLSQHATDRFGEEVVKYCDKRGDLHLTFSDLHKLSKKDLQVIATDVASGRTCVYSYKETPNDCVFQAIAASASYPFVYEPKSDENRYLVDGGLSCNLPTYLFHGDKYKSLPIFAFDLYKKTEQQVGEQSSFGIIEFTKKLLFSALDASDDIINNVVGSISVPVQVSANIGTLDFNLSNDQVEGLYRSGYESAKSFISSHVYTKLLRDNRQNNEFKARLLYGHCHEPILEALINKANYAGDVPIKAWLYTSIDAHNESIFSFAKYAEGAEIDHHTYNLDTLNLDCVRAWNEKKEFFSHDSGANKTRICFPIIRNSVQYHLDQENNKDYADSVVLGVLCIAINCGFKDSCWFSESQTNASGFDIDEDFVEVVQPYIDIIEKVMLGSQSSFTFKETDND